jgi:hypothetical protein
VLSSAFPYLDFGMRFVLADERLTEEQNR